jgi:hypothetical protein
MKKTDNPISYESYSYINSLLSAAADKLDCDFHNACWFIPDEEYSPKKKSGKAKAHEIFTKRYAAISAARREFQAVAKMAYKNHPNPKMRAFWCVNEPV